MPGKTIRNYGFAKDTGGRALQRTCLLKLPVRRYRRIAAVLLLRRAKELVLCVKRIALNEVALAAAQAVLQLVTRRPDVEKPDASSFAMTLILNFPCVSMLRRNWTPLMKRSTAFP